MSMGAKDLRHVIVIGAGFGGLSAARKLAQQDGAVRVTVIDRSNHHLFQPLLYQVATAGLSPSDIAYPVRSVFRDCDRVEVLLAEVIGVDAVRHRVRIRPPSTVEEAAQELEYDFLVIATGATHSYFGHDEWAAHAPGLKTIDDATRIRGRVLLAFEGAEMESDEDARKALLTFAIIGGVPTGVGLAGSIAELAGRVVARDFRHIDPRSTRILLIEAGPRVLASFPENLSRDAEAELRRLGVEVRTGARVSGVEASGVRIAQEFIPARTVLWAAGVVASPAGKWLDAETDRSGRVKVLPDLTVPGHPEIFVVGDTAALEIDGKALPGLAPVAMQQGRYVARAILARLGGATALEPFRYFDKGNLATIGRSFAVMEFKQLKASGFGAWLAWVGVHIYYLIGFRAKLIVLIQWAWSYLSWKRGARLITRSEALK